MKRIFIVDDNPGKLAELTQSARQLFADAEIYTYVCSNDFLCAVGHDYKGEILAKPNEHLMIVDMQMPSREKGRIEVNEGYNVLSELRRLCMKCPAIIASSGPVDEGRARNEYDYYKGWVTPIGAMRSALTEYLPSESKIER